MPNRCDLIHARSLDDPEGFWAEAANEVHWYKKWTTVLEIGRAHV